MSQIDYRGARGSNAGDDFHELWVLRQALKLFDRESSLTAIAVEGLRAEDEAGTPKDAWNGVDCTFYYGGDSAATAQEIVIDQVKYSAASPEQPWTIARLVHSTNKTKDNSVVGRLSKAYVAARRLITSNNGKSQIRVRLVSNQPVADEILDLTDDNRSRLQEASSLSDDDFALFWEALDLTETGQKGRSALEYQIQEIISGWTDADSRSVVDQLMRKVRQLMMPEGLGQVIYREIVLSWMGISDFSALFPCQSLIEKVERPVRREISQSIVDQLVAGNQFLCLHGEGGCGKTTVLQQVADALPEGSTIITFDCYGGGHYLDSDGYRHRPKDAFLQLSNELAGKLQIPLLLNRSDAFDYPKAFKKRLQRASEVTTAKSNRALLLVAIDAADNSITAALSHSPPEPSFVHDFVRLGDLPPNVRFIVSCRSGLLSSLELPTKYRQVQLSNFDWNQTSEYVSRYWPDAPKSWIDDFHHLSSGRPRVQHYAFEYARSEPSNALEYLHPHGKSLDEVFRERFQSALRQGGSHDIRNVCAGLIELPRPIPIGILSTVIAAQEAHVRDICSDLAPGIRVVDNQISFADADFETFVRSEAPEDLSSIKNSIARYLHACRQSDEYAARHVGTALFRANLPQQIINLVKIELEPKAIVDPILRREVELQRLQLAMKVCREAGNNVDALLTLLVGAESVKTDTAIKSMFQENPDLAATFARDSAARGILRDSDAIEHHGPFLFQSMAVDSRNGDAISVREDSRHLGAWLQLRREKIEEEEQKNPGFGVRGWDISASDIAAQTEAVLRTAGPLQASRSLRRWSPRSIAFQVVVELSRRFIIKDEGSLIKDCLTKGIIESPWDIFALIPLTIAGEDVDVHAIGQSLKGLYTRRLIPSLEKVDDLYDKTNPKIEWLEFILTACEIVATRKGDTSQIIPILTTFANPEVRRRDKHILSKPQVLDLCLRAFSLLENINGRDMTLESFWVDPPKPSKDLTEEKAHKLEKEDNEAKEEFRRFVGPCIDLYDVRSKAIVGRIENAKIEERLKKATGRFKRDDYDFMRRYNATLLENRILLSITRLMIIKELDRMAILRCAWDLLDSRQYSLGEQEAIVFSNLSLDRSLHSKIIEETNDLVTKIRACRISSREKIQALVRISRLLMPISEPDAKAVFSQAVDVANEVDYEAVHEISLFAALAQRGTPAMSIKDRRDVASELALVVSDAAIRLSDDKHFGWYFVAEAMATFDINVALAAIGRWEDANIVSRYYLLPVVLSTGLRQHQFTAEQAGALLYFVDERQAEVIERIVEQTNSTFDNRLLTLIGEEIARDEVLRANQESMILVYSNLKRLTAQSSNGFWIERLKRAVDFLQTNKPNKERQERFEPIIKPTEEVQKSPEVILNGIDWNGRRFISSEEIVNVLRYVSDQTSTYKGYISEQMVLDRIRANILPADRIAHLEAILEIDSSDLSDYELRYALLACLDGWGDTPSIQFWCRNRLLKVIESRLATFSVWVSTGESRLPDLLNRTGASNDEIFNSLVAGVEQHVDSFEASTICGLVGLAVQYCDPKDVSDLTKQYLSRLLLRVPLNDREIWDTDDIPMQTSGGVARFLYAYMSDIDVRLRWRAAHSMRRLARLGCTQEIDELIKLYPNQREVSFRKPDAPFYWLAARLWLVMALDRIASETPKAIAHEWRFLFDVATDENFPHVLLRSFAKSTVQKLAKVKAAALNKRQHRKLNLSNSGRLRRTKQPYESRFGDGGRPLNEDKKRRFEFNWTDTLPYWYNTPIACFAQLKQSEFLDVAESWVVDRWKAPANISYWDSEPRKDRLSSKYPLYSHSHGGRPTIERYHTYLEWHAMFCATGELMQTRPLAKADNYSLDTYESWLKDEGLSTASKWLCDFRGGKPLEERYWFKPSIKIDVWVEDIYNEEFLREIGLLGDGESVVAQGYHSTGSYEFNCQVVIRSAFVSPITASSLVRALQSVDYSNDYHIPSNGDELEINSPPYKLTGWLRNVGHASGIDERDASRHGVREIEYEPTDELKDLLHLRFDDSNESKWSNPRNPAISFLYEAWGDRDDSEGDQGYAYSEFGSSGWLLRVSKEALMTVLEKKGSDLIIEVKIEKRNRGYGRHYDEEKVLEATFDKIILLRKEGTIETSEGRIGTWAAPRSRTRAGKRR